MSRNQHPIKPMKPITIGNRENRQKYVSDEQYLEERYEISRGLRGAKRLENESQDEYKTRRKAENGLVKEYLRGVWVTDKD